MNPKIKSTLINNLSPDWKKFAYGTELNLHIIEYIDLKRESNQFKMELFLNELVSRNANEYISLIENSLRELGKKDILYEIQAFRASYQLKQHYIKKHGSAHQPISQHDEENNILDTSTNHFDFVRVDNSHYINISESFDEWKDFNSNKNYCRTVTFEEVFTQDLSLLLVSGISGIGKTYLLKKCLVYWAKELIWNNIEFVFYLNLQKIAFELKDISSVNKLIMKFYGNVLKRLEISSQSSVKLIIDGLDKFIYLKNLINYNLDNISDIPLINTLEYVLRSTEIKCVLAGTVDAIATYWNTIKKDKKEVHVQITGFNKLGINYYVENNLHIPIIKNCLYELLSSSSEGKLIIFVPFYLKAICLTLLNTTIVSVKTVTELQALIFYFFIQKNDLLKTKSLHELIQSNKLHILKVCKIAFILQEKNRTFICKEKMNYLCNKFDIEQSDFIEMSNINQQYKFTHPIIMNFCASVYMYYYECPQTGLSNLSLHVCLPIASALSYGSERNILSLICNLNEPIYKEKLWVQEIYDYKDRKLFIQSLYESQISLNGLKVSFDVLNQWNYALLCKDAEKPQQYFNREIKNLDCFEKIKVTVHQARNVYKKKNYQVAEQLFREVEKKQVKHLGDKHAETITTKYMIAQCLFNKRYYDDAEKMYKDVENLRKEVLGETHEETITTKYMIAQCLYYKENYDDAIKLFEEIENTRKEILGCKSEEKITTKYMIAQCLYYKKYYNDAEKLHREVKNTRKIVKTIIEKDKIAQCLFNKRYYNDAKKIYEEIESVRKETLGENHKETIDTKFMIAQCLYYNESYDDAIKLFEEVESIRKDILGDNHEETITTKYMVACCLYNKRYYDDAQILFEKVESMRKEVLGGIHAKTVRTKYMIACCLYYKKYYNDAKMLFVEVENMFKEVLGKKHEETITTKYLIACCLYYKENYDEAQQLFEEVENIRKVILGCKHEETITTKFMVAQCLYYKGNYDDAKKFFEEVENTRKEVCGHKNVETINAKFMIAQCLYNKKYYDDAETLFGEVNNTRKEILGEKHRETVTTKYMIACCLYNKRNYDDAEKIFEEVKILRKEDLGDKHTETITTKYMIAQCLYNKRYYDHAERIFEDVQNMRKEILGDKHAETITAKYMIAQCLYNKRYYDDAEKFYNDVESLRKEVLGEKHEETLTTKYMIAQCLYYKENYEEAKNLFEEVESFRKEILGEKHPEIVTTKYMIACCLYFQNTIMKPNSLKKLKKRGKFF